MRSGERSFGVVAEWDGVEALAAARPAIVANLNAAPATDAKK
jgi:hypothetical protein